MQRPLWPHQQAALKACLETLGRKPGYVQMPTGSGKSDVMRLVALEWLRDQAHKVIIAVPNQTLALQHRAGFILHSKQLPTLLLEGFPLARSSRLVISTYASINKINRHYHYFPVGKTLLLADECHHCNANAEVNQGVALMYKQRIGFSATPWTLGCSSLFGENFLYALSLKDAQKDGFLCDYKIHECDELIPNHSLRYQMYFVKDSSRFSQLVLRRSVYFDDETTPSRPYSNRQLIQLFRNGEISCVYINRMLLEGFDCAKVKHIFIEKHTASQMLAMQMMGRGLRKTGSQICNVYVNNAMTYDTLQHALERANTPEQEPCRWHENS